MAAPTVVTGFTASSGASSTTCAVTTPTHAAGDVIYIGVVQDATATFTEPSGFSVLYADITLSGFGGETMAVYYKTAGSSEPADYTVTSDATERWVFIAFAVNGDGGIDVSGTPNTGSGASATVPSITTTVNDCLIVVLVGTDGISTPHSTITDYTFIGETSFSSGGSISAQHKVLATAGTESGNAVSITSEQWGAVAWAIAPVAGGGIEGAASITLSALTLAATGTLPILGTASITLAALTSTATGVVPIVGAASITLDALTLTATGTLTTEGAASITLGALTLTATGALAIKGTASITLGALTLVAGNEPIQTQAGFIYGPGPTALIYGPSATVVLFGPSPTALVYGPTPTGVVYGPSPTAQVEG
jgi:hypothetical protein